MWFIGVVFSAVFWGFVAYVVGSWAYRIAVRVKYRGEPDPQELAEVLVEHLDRDDLALCYDVFCQEPKLVYVIARETEPWFRTRRGTALWWFRACVEARKRTMGSGGVYRSRQWMH